MTVDCPLSHLRKRFHEKVALTSNDLLSGNHWPEVNFIGRFKGRKCAYNYRLRIHLAIRVSKEIADVPAPSHDGTKKYLRHDPCPFIGFASFDATTLPGKADDTNRQTSDLWPDTWRHQKTLDEISQGILRVRVQSNVIRFSDKNVFDSPSDNRSKEDRGDPPPLHRMCVAKYAGRWLLFFFVINTFKCWFWLRIQR